MIDIDGLQAPAHGGRCSHIRKVPKTRVPRTGVDDQSLVGSTVWGCTSGVFLRTVIDTGSRYLYEWSPDITVHREMRRDSEYWNVVRFVFKAQ